MITTLLWDFDGTLVDTNKVVMESWQVTYEHYYGHRMPDEHITNFFGEPLLVTMAREFPGVDPAESAEVYRSFQREIGYTFVRQFPGVFDAVRKFRDLIASHRHIPAIIVSAEILMTVNRLIAPCRAVGCL